MDEMGDPPPGCSTDAPAADIAEDGEQTITQEDAEALGARPIDKDAAGKKSTTRRDRLFQLKRRIHEARQLNFQEAKAEQDRKDRPGVGTRRRIQRAKDDELRGRKTHLQAAGQDASKTHLFDTAEAVEWRGAKRRRTEKRDKKKATEDFHETSTMNTYKRYVKGLDTEKLRERYRELKKTLPPEMLYQEADSEYHGVTVVQPKTEDIAGVQAQIDANIKRRQAYSRRRVVKVDADVDYINERNRLYNQRIAQAFDKYTVEIKQNLERGTAI